MSLCLAILGRLMRSLGQAPISAKSESDWIHFVTPRHRKETMICLQSVGSPTWRRIL
jgi:hypothetical protein